MRAYFFGNMYLSSIQQGIQAAHVVHELFVMYPSPTPVLREGQQIYLDTPSKTLYDWAIEHKTMILLNGGYSENLRRLETLFEDSNDNYPWTVFHEGEDALDGALTCVGIVLPEKIYVTADMVRKDVVGDEQLFDGVVFNPEDPAIEWSFSRWEIKLIHELNNYSLAH